MDRVETVVTDGPANQQVEAAAQAKQNQAPVAAPPSPLGVDAAVVEAVADRGGKEPSSATGRPMAQTGAQAPATEVPPEYAQKLQAYDAIMGNPRLFEALRREYLAMEGGAEEVPKQNGAAEAAPVSPAVAQQLAEVRREVQYMKAAQVVEEFRRSHADFDTHRDAILKELNEAPGIPLEKAYRLAKAGNGHAEQKSVPTSERQTRGDAQSGGFDLDTLSKEAADRTKFKRTEDAVRHIFGEVIRNQGG